MRIIPAIDIIEGKCVRLTKGDYTTKKIYNANPLEVAKQFEDNGIKQLHLVDLDGAKSKHIVNQKVLEQIASETNLEIDFGGGLKSDDDVRIAFECGASKITGGSIAAQNPEIFQGWLTKYGANRVILGADTKNRKIAVNGWQENVNIDVLEFIRDYEKQGVQYTLCTDVSKDGMLQGPSIELYVEIITHSNVKLIASGGISCMQDLRMLKSIGCEGAIVGKAIYEGKIKMEQLNNFNR